MLGKKLSPKTINNALAVLSKMLRYAEEIEIIKKVPRIRMLKICNTKFDFLDFDEAERLLEAAKYNPEWYRIIFFGIRTGLRFGEISELRWSDVNIKIGRMMIRRSFYKGEITTPKGGRERELPLSSQTVELLKQHHHQKGQIVFCKTDGERRSYSTVRDGLELCCKKAGLRRITPHVLRHTFASHLAMKGVPIKTIQELLGHATIDMTMRYAHLSPEVKREGVNLLDSAPEALRHHSVTKPKNDEF